MAKNKDKEKTNAMRLLDRNHIAYETHSYECDDFIDGIHIADKMGQAYETSYKTLVTIAKSKKYYVFAIPVDQEIDLKKAAKVVGEKAIEMLPVKEINQVTGYIRGGCTPLGMKKLYPTVIQEEAQQHEKIIVSGGKLGSQIELAPLDLAKVVNAQFADVIKTD